MAAEISRGTSLTMDCTVPGRRPFLLRSGRFTGGGLSLLRGGGLTRLGCVLRRVLSPLPCLITLTAAHWSQAKKAGGNATVLSLLKGHLSGKKKVYYGRVRSMMPLTFFCI